MTMVNPQRGRWISEQEAIQRFDIHEHPPISNFGYPGVLLHEGDLDLSSCYHEAQNKELSTPVSLWSWLGGASHVGEFDFVHRHCLIIIDGSIDSDAPIRLPSDPRICLLVRQHLRVPWVELSHEQAILVQGDAIVDAAIIATGVSGEMHVAGSAEVLFVLNNGDNRVTAGTADWREVSYRKPRDLELICAELGITGIDFDDPESEPHERLIEALLA